MRTTLDDVTSAPLSRRRLLQVGTLGATGLSLPTLLAAEQRRGGSVEPLADACILIFLNGGPSHLDMWDPKPDAPNGIRGPFQPIATSLPGYRVSDQLPKLAKQMHRATVVRSMHHSVNNSHAAAVYCAMTGHDRGEKGGGARPDDNPTPGSVLAMLRPPTRAIAPNVHMPYITKEGAKGPPQPGFFGGYLGAGHDPLFVLKDPNAKNFRVSELTLLHDVSAKRLEQRRQLFAQIDRQLATRKGLANVDAMDGFQRRAFELLTSKDTQRAFKLSEEPDKTRSAYGRNRYGQSVLLARRLIEAGTRMVTVSWAPDANATWDTHGNNFNKLKNTLLPQFDAAWSSLIQDLVDRRMLKRTLVAVLGDFGRTPKINKNAGRDHWNFCYSLMLAGGGFRRGLIHGTSDRIGGFPASLPLRPGDIVSTIYHALGIPHDREIRDRLNRPHRLVPQGRVVTALLDR
ncbi:MAG: DUF1501 domain-containing protein [Planctomycetaceae bacterium]